MVWLVLLLKDANYVQARRDNFTAKTASEMVKLSTQSYQILKGEVHVNQYFETQFQINI